MDIIIRSFKKTHHESDRSGGPRYNLIFLSEPTSLRRREPYTQISLWSRHKFVVPVGGATCDV